MGSEQAGGETDKMRNGGTGVGGDEGRGEGGGQLVCLKERKEKTEIQCKGGREKRESETNIISSQTVKSGFCKWSKVWNIWFNRLQDHLCIHSQTVTIELNDNVIIVTLLLKNFN